ncbi:MAG: hypothetical protein OXC79_07250 [Candidatus Poribacteria bacterium]|nr:hypothetical protein [Candidatus Poribacteria bacterium]
MEYQLYVIVDVPISFKDKEHDELAYDIERYGGIIHKEEWHDGPDPAFDWVSTRVIIPAKWVNNLKPQEVDEEYSLILDPLFRLPNGRLVIETQTLDVDRKLSVIYEPAVPDDL